jgi:subtilisin-like proprotein convertase family protein
MTSELAVSDTGPVVDLNVKLNISHSYNADLAVYLIAPDGTRVELFTEIGGASKDFDNTILDDEASLSITEGSAPFDGSYRPEGDLADFRDKEISGTWILEVTDSLSGDTGTLDSWCLIVTTEPKEPLPAPVIQSESSVPGGMHDTIYWDGVGETRQYQTDTPLLIPDQGTATSTLDIGGSGAIEDLNVQVNISHDWDSELDVYLIAPDETRVELFTDVGGSKDDFSDTILDDQAPVSITQGEAPFTGSYRPEGALDDLIGKDIQGEWQLEITDDSWYGSGTLNSWSLMADLADVLYYAECAADAGFAKIVTDSGWMIDTSCTFAGLDPDRQYWYRAKARPLETWSQTSQADFEADILTATEATDVGDVVLPSGGGGLGPEIHVIENPSFESGGAWIMGSNNPDLFRSGMGGVPDDLWVSDGSLAAAVLFSEDSSYDKGDMADFLQTVDWTGVETLVFDYCSIFASQVVPKVLIGDTEVWSGPDMGESMAVRNDVTIDVSDFTGREVLTLRVEVIRGGWFWAGILWDNLRTYGPSSPSSGSVISTPIGIRPNDTWDILAFDVTTPPGTELTVDILREAGSNPIAGYADVLTGTDLSGLAGRTIRLRANLSTGNSGETPVLHSWSVSYSDAGRESDWSNVESSRP